MLSQQVDVRLSQTSTNFSERLQRITERQEQIWEARTRVRMCVSCLEVSPVVRRGGLAASGKQFSGVVSCEVRAEKQHLEVKASDAAERVQERLRDAV